MKPCDACTIGKAQQKNVAKTSSGEKTNDVNGQWYHDISTVKSRDKSFTVSTPQWHMIVDELSGLKYSQIYAKKNKFVKPMLCMMHKAMQQGTPVQFVRDNNSGENKLLQKLAHGKDWKLQTKFELRQRQRPNRTCLSSKGSRSLPARQDRC